MIRSVRRRGARWAIRLSQLCCMLVLSLQAAQVVHAAEIHIASAYAVDNFQTVNLQRYADDVEQATGGQVRMKVHAAGTLLKPTEIFNGVRDGRAEAGAVIMSSLAKEIPLFGMDALPFIVSGYDDARRMWNTSRPAVERALNERGLQLLYAVAWPPQNLYARKPVTSIQSFKGMRMRSYNPATERIAELVGAQPVGIQAVELEKAIADEKLDLMLTSSWTGVETKAWTRLQYYYKVSAWIPKNIVFINKKFFDKLDGATQKKMLDAAHTAEERGWKLSRDSDQEFENQLVANKINVATIEPYIRRSLDRIGETLAREWLKQAGPAELNVLLKYTTERSMQMKTSQ